MIRPGFKARGCPTCLALGRKSTDRVCERARVALNAVTLERYGDKVGPLEEASAFTMQWPDLGFLLRADFCDVCGTLYVYECEEMSKPEPSQIAMVHITVPGPTPEPEEGGQEVEGPKNVTSEHNPNQGGEGSAGSRGYETDGAPGDKMDMPAAVSSGSSNDGNHDQAAHNAFNAQHGRPAVSATPDNVEGSLESDNPTRGEGATGMQDVPHAGPPPGTTSVGKTGTGLE